MALKDASREVRLQCFARRVLDEALDGLDVCGGDIQEWARAAGLLDEHIVTEADLAPDSETLHGVRDAEFLSIGDSWFSFSGDLKDENVRWSELFS